MMRALAFVVVAALAAGCGSRCKDVASARDLVVARPPIAIAGADVRVTVPLARANELIAVVLQATPVEAALELPAGLPLAVPALVASVREVRMVPGGPGRVRIALRIEIRERAAAHELTTLALVAEVAPEIERVDGGVELAIGIGADSLVAVTPELGPGARGKLGDALLRQLRPSAQALAPRALVEEVGATLASHLVGAGFRGLRATLLERIGELTRVRVRLPEVPVTDVVVSSASTPAAALVVELTTGLPVRRRLGPPGPPSEDVTVELSGTAVAELANWAVDAGLAPRWYSRSLEPKADGEFRPRFDYVAEERGHPFKVYVFQERGGCSYFRVGVRAALALRGGQLVVTALDRQLERRRASPIIEAAAWAKYFVTGSIDRSKRIAAHTRLTVGPHTLEPRVVAAALADDELKVGLGFAIDGPPSPGPTGAEAASSRGR